VATNLNLVLANSPFRKLIAARLISNFGNGIGPIALSFGVLDLPNGNAGTLSFVMFAQMVPLVAFMLFGGVIADRYPKALMVGGSDVVLSAVIFLNAALFITGFATIASTAILAFITGILHAMWWPAMSTLTPDIVAEDELQTANSAVSLSSNITFILGSVTGGFIVAATSAGWALMLDGATFFLAGILVLQLRKFGTTRKQDDDSPTVMQDLKLGWREFISRTWVVAVVLGYSVILMVDQSIYYVVGPAHAKEFLGGPKPWSWVLAALSAGMLSGVVVTMRLKPKRPIFIGVVAQLGMGIFFAALAFTTSLPLILVGAFCAGFAMDFFYVLWQTALQTQIPRDALARVSSYDAFGSMALAPLGMIIAGPLVVRFGSPTVLKIETLVFFLALFAILSVPSVRSLPNNEPASQSAD